MVNPIIRAEINFSHTPEESFSAKVYHHPEDKAFHSKFEGVKMGIMEGSKRKTHRI